MKLFKPLDVNFGLKCKCDLVVKNSTVFFNGEKQFIVGTFMNTNYWFNRVGIERLRPFQELMTEADLRGSEVRRPPPPCATIAVFGKNLSNNRLAPPRGWHPLWEILDPPLHEAHA